MSVKPVRRLLPMPSAANHYLSDHVRLLTDSFHALTGRHLIDPALPADIAARQIFASPFVVLSHNTDPDPILTYANRAGLQLFEMDWRTLVATPSRCTAEVPLREERERLLQRVSEAGYIDDYAGVRVSATGRRFRIEQATVWNLTEAGVCKGQAATFSRWNFL